MVDYLQSKIETFSGINASPVPPVRNTFEPCHILRFEMSSFLL